MTALHWLGAWVALSVPASLVVSAVLHGAQPARPVPATAETPRRHAA